MKYWNKESNEWEDEKKIKTGFEELQGNSNEFNRFTFEGFLKKYYRKTMPKEYKKWLKTSKGGLNE